MIDGTSNRFLVYLEWNYGLFGMELSGCNGLNYDIGEKALRGLLDTFGSVFTLKEIAFTYRNAGRNPDLGGEFLYPNWAGEFLCDK